MAIDKKQIEAWKAQYEEISEIKVKGKVAYLRPLDRTTLRMITSTSTDSVDVAEKILANLWLGGDECIKTNDVYFVAAIPALDKIWNNKESSLKKILNKPEEMPEETSSTGNGL